MEYEKIGIRIKTLRKKLKFTQQQLADKIFKTESSIQKYEKGLVEIPISVLMDISQALSISFNDLVGIEPVTRENVIYQDENFVILSNTREIKENQIDRIKYDLLMDTKEVE